MDLKNNDTENISSQSQTTTNTPLAGESIGQSDTSLSPRRRNKLWVIVLVIALVLAAAVIAIYLLTKPDAQQASRIVKVGLMTPLYGDNVSYGTAMKQGVELALKEFNQEGTTIQLITKITNCDEESGKTGAQELITKDKVVAIVGENCSSATLAAAPLANQYHVPLVSPSATSPDITQAGDYVFRLAPSDTLQGEYASKLLQKNGVNRLAIIYTDEAYGIGLADSIEKSFSDLGGQIVAREKLPDATTQVDQTIQNLKKLNPDAIYMAVLARTTGVAITLQAKQLGLNAKLYATENMKDSAFINDVGAQGEGLIVNAVSEGNESFLAKYRAAYGADSPTSFSAQSYDAFNAIARTIRGGADTGEEIKNALYKVSFEGASGRITFDSNGDVPGNYNAFVIRDQKYVPENQ